jgi:hypothetical protein
MSKAIIIGGIISALVLIAVAIVSIMNNLALTQQLSDVARDIIELQKDLALNDAYATKIAGNLELNNTYATEIAENSTALGDELYACRFDLYKARKENLVCERCETGRQLLETYLGLYEYFRDYSSALNDEIEKCEERYSDLFAEYTDELDKYNELDALYADKYICDEYIDMDYSSVTASLQDLKNFYARQPSVERVTDEYTENLWNNTGSKIHTLVYISEEDGMEYIDHFVVYFNEPGMRQGTFWVKKQCWLDPP